ncbi:hypothetical protein [Prochlorococcus sp. MIT 1318]|uniref:hypothetical protein n=1 Tax=Prochlorococcus sp. MIT 1318 TaxID=3082531 RepID=UPI0039B6DEB9
MHLGLTLFRKHTCDGCGQGCFAVVDMADGANVDVRLVPLKLLASHCVKESGGGKWVL